MAQRVYDICDSHKKIQGDKQNSCTNKTDTTKGQTGEQVFVT